MENVWHKGWDLCRFLRCQLARDCDFGSRKGTCSSAHILLDTHGRVRKEWNLQKRSQAPIKLFVQVHGTRVKSTQSVLSRLVSVCPCCFAFVGGLFSTSMIFISSTPSLCAMNVSSRLFRLGDHFHLKIGSNPGRADLARGRAGLAQSNLESL